MTTGRSSCSSSPAMTNSSPITLDLCEQKAMLRQQIRRRTGGNVGQILERSRSRDGPLFRSCRANRKCLRWSRGRVALVGDAAFCVSLMAGQGSALAMTAAYVLAGELAKACGRHDEAFDRNEMLLRAFIESKQKGAERFSAAFAPRTRFGLFLRNQVIRACAIPGVARLALSRGHCGHAQASRLSLAGARPGGRIDCRAGVVSSLRFEAIDQRSPSGRSGDILEPET